MPHFLKTPNLPDGQVCVVAVGEDYAKEIGTALSAIGIQAIACPSNLLVDERLKSHIDLSLFHLGENRFVISSYISQSYFSDKLENIGAKIIVSDSKLKPDYPYDASLCALSVGEELFHNLKYSDKMLIDNSCCKKIHVNQGYAKCAVCLLSNTAAITADAGLAKAMKNEGIDVLEISSEGIELKGYNEGFIGGASLKISRDKLAFTGNLNNHPNKTDIYEFLKLHKICPVFLTDKPVFDVGSVIPIIEL